MQSLTIVIFVALAFTATIVTAWPVPELQSNEQFVPEVIDVVDLPDSDPVILMKSKEIIIRSSFGI